MKNISFQLKQFISIEKNKLFSRSIAFLLRKSLMIMIIISAKTSIMSLTLN